MSAFPAQHSNKCTHCREKVVLEKCSRLPFTVLDLQQLHSSFSWSRLLPPCIQPMHAPPFRLEIESGGYLSESWGAGAAHSSWRRRAGDGATERWSGKTNIPIGNRCALAMSSDLALKRQIVEIQLQPSTSMTHP
jgi:hypothetical protein